MLANSTKARAQALPCHGKRIVHPPSNQTTLENYGLAFLGIEHVDHEAHHAAGSIELARLAVGGVGKLLDQYS